jgi:hypothetical protein
VETANAAAGLLGSMTGLDTVEIVDVCLCYSVESQVLVVMIYVLVIISVYTCVYVLKPHVYSRWLFASPVCMHTRIHI